MSNRGWGTTKSRHSPDKLGGVGKDVSKGCTEDDRVLPFAVLDDVIRKVEEVQAVIVVGWWGVGGDNRTSQRVTQLPVIQAIYNSLISQLNPS